MAQSIKLSDEVMDVVRREAELQSRSIAGQLTHWARIGRAVEKTGRFDYRRIEQALGGKLSPDALSSDEQDVWFDAFAEAVTGPTAEEEAFFAERRKLGRGVGLDENGRLVRQEPKP
ncbi:ParD-like family protein [Amorphus coralli]|uniref:ParD-like family protein n=1 Tax=Amorphus coralli TaxID=340680 RepID=UPI000368A50D|nr:ParD-like family protein [Amorphus coralli]